MTAAVLPSVADLTRGMDEEQKAALAARLRAHTARLRTLREFSTPAALAESFDTTYVRTPAVECVSDALVGTVRTPDGRLIVSAPPQEFKSTLARAFIVWLLVDDPTRRVLYVSYAAGLARTSGRIVRGLIETHGDRLGLGVDRAHRDASDWQLDGHRGGLLTVGVGGSLTGRPGDVLLIDDPLRNQQDADSPVVRGRVHEWWEAVARTRLAPGAPVVVIQTRWHQDDLAGRMESHGWPVLNIPAVADGSTPDALGRPVGTYLTSTRGREPADWDAIRSDVGERTWAALYQGRPAPLEGGVFKQAWFDTWRVDTLPAGCAPMTVVVDPADNEGDGDEAGILLATTHPASGRVFIVDDLSAPMTVARWARVALLTCVRRDAPTLTYEQSLSQIPKKVREAWKTLHQQATALHKTGLNPADALARLSRPDDSQDTRQAIEQGLAELTAADVAAILRIGVSGPNLHKITPKGNKESRMLWAAPEFETGRAVIVGHLPALEYQARTWQVGMSSPDRVDAMVHATSLGAAQPARLGRTDDRVPTRSTARSTTSSRITRSARR